MKEQNTYSLAKRLNVARYRVKRAMVGVSLEFRGCGRTDEAQRLLDLSSFLDGALMAMEEVEGGSHA